MQEIEKLLLDRHYIIKEKWKCNKNGVLSEFMEFQIVRKKYHIAIITNERETLYVLSHYVKITNWDIDIKTTDKQKLIDKIKTLKELKGV